MNPQHFDAFTRQAGQVISRRRSLMTLGGATAALAASLADPLNAGAKKNAAKKAKKKAKKKCKKQVQQCSSFLEAFCEANETDPEQCEQTLDCCSFLGQCNANGFLACLIAVQNG